MSGSKRASPVQCCVTAPISTRTAFGLSLPQSASLMGCARLWSMRNPSFLIGSTAFPPGNFLTGATIVRRWE